MPFSRRASPDSIQPLDASPLPLHSIHGTPGHRGVWLAPRLGKGNLEGRTPCPGAKTDFIRSLRNLWFFFSFRRAVSVCLPLAITPSFMAPTASVRRGWASARPAEVSAQLLQNVNSPDRGMGGSFFSDAEPNIRPAHEVDKRKPNCREAQCFPKRRSRPEGNGRCADALAGSGRAFRTFPDIRLATAWFF